ncbi:MAG: dephospho-CoA kinase [Firmicutes bacterium]|nr:dephospho-CoA kinase [Bacillota bacterium]
MDNKVKVVGLTGGIGTGKSTAAEYLKKKGFAHIDADQIGRDITADGSPMLPVLDGIFGPTGEYGCEGFDILREDGSLDRKALASIVFTDMNKKLKLDEVMFKAIIAETKRLVEVNSQDDPVGILIDAPLLFEAGLDKECDLVLLIVADMDVRIHRVCARDGATEQEVRNRINSQMSDEEKISRSHVVVDNSGSLEELEKQLEEFFSKFSKNS